MFTPRHHQHRTDFEFLQQADAAETARRSNRRRLTVFLIVFLTTLLPGLAWNFLRPAEYRAAARVQITPGAVSPRADNAVPAANVAEQSGPRIDVLTQIQILNSRSLLEEVARRLSEGGRPAALPESDPVADLQNAISASPVSGTDIVEVQAIGASPQWLARVVNTLVEAYRERLLASHGSASQDVLVNLRDEVERLGTTIADKRAQLAAFRERSGVVSSERSENAALARIKGLSESLNRANEDAAKAEARLRTLRESAASGRSPVLSKDNPTQAAIEQRISATREQLRDMERSYTPDFMAMDPTARSLRGRLTELERQLASNRSTSQQAALAASEEEVAGTRAMIERLRGQLEAQRREAQIFSGNFHEAKALEDDLVRLEGARRNASERLARLEASANARMPTLKVIEAASVPQKPWQPDYLRDALYNLLASFVLGLLALWFVELFNRSASPASTTVVVPQPWMTSSLSMETALPAPGRALELEHHAGPQDIPQLPSRASLPRELSQDEVAALLAGADGDGRVLCALLLVGLSVDELKTLACTDIDLDTLQLKVRGPSARTLPLPDWLALPLAKCRDGNREGPLLANSLDQPLSESDIRTRVACAALDAGVESAATLSPEVLRHTYIAYLMRQNVRFSDLAPLAGQLGADELAAYAETSSGLQRVRGELIDPLMPALRQATIG